MKGFYNTPAFKNFGLLVLRLAFAGIFIMAGWSKLSGIEGTASFFASLNLPAETFLAYLVGVVEFIGGIALLIGFQTKNAAVLLAIIMIVAFFTAHIGDGIQAPGSLYVIALIGGLFSLMATGAGDWKLGKGDMS